MGLCPRPLQHSQDLLLNLGKGGEERERKERELGEEMEGERRGIHHFLFHSSTAGYKDYSTAAWCPCYSSRCYTLPL